MAYMPIFAELYDGIGTVQTHSLRGLVYHINCDINSEIGKVGSLSANIDDRTEYDFNRLEQCKERIGFWCEKGKIKRTYYWKEQLKIEERKKEEEDKRKVNVSLSLSEKTKMNLSVNNVLIDRELLEILSKASDMGIVKEILKKHIGSIEGL